MTDNNGSAAGGQPGANGAGGEWYAGISDEGLRGYVQTKGFKDPGALAESYRNLEKLQGVPQDRLLRLPDKSDAPEWGDVYSRLGRPADAKGYELKHDGDAAFAERMAGVMFDAGLTKAQAGKLNETWNAYVAEIIEQDTNAKKAADVADMDKLKGEWGNTFDANVETGRRAGREFGLNEEQFAQISGALGSAQTLKLFQAIGSKLGEAKGFDPSGMGQGGQGFSQSPEQAKARIGELQRDKDWVGRYLNGGSVERDEMTKLQRIAAGGQ